MKEENGVFSIITEGDLLKALVFPDDPYAMNWVEGGVPWGTVKVCEGLSAAVSRSFTPQGAIRETYTFTNTSEYPVFCGLRDIGIYVPFNDSYHEAALCMKNRCHAHIWCGGTSSYVMCLRMGGEAPHLGLVLIRGSLGAYSVERDLSLSSNDRGDFIVHPSPVRLESGGSYTLGWELFKHKGKDDFYRILRTYPSYIEIEADHFVVFQDEKNSIAVKQRENQPALTLCPAEAESPVPGEQKYLIRGDDADAWCRTVTIPPLRELAARRCAFIVKNQQYHRLGSPLDGAYLIYDTEENHLCYRHVNDDNGGRERIAMGLLIARYLKSHPDADLETSLKQYISYVLRELFDSETGTVYNDIKRSVDCVRLYNYPWLARFFLELYNLWNENAYLRYMWKALTSFYEKGGAGFYAIGLPIAEGLSRLEEAGLAEEAKTLRDFFLKHADRILENGVNYPAHEVKYEQSIAAPAASILLQTYRFSKDEKYLAGAKKQLSIVSLFNGLQPDAYLYETSIRHWDGFWFGKRRLYGDTFPHYWSALTGTAFAEYYRVSGDEDALKQAEHSIRGVLSLFFADGSASCAHVYPLTVNGQQGGYFDPWANDQDWGLYLALKFFDGDF
ncbi:MAG: hypothetical protein LBC62_03320 [Treponema sp.]|jgi:hypothetical protein|nr:hypothetical protein [Treponema sp.]